MDNLLNVNTGDIVKVKFDDKDESIITVEHVKTRFGRYQHGGPKTNPLITYYDENSVNIITGVKGEIRSCDLSFVKEIIKRDTTSKMKENIYRHYNAYYTSTKDYIIGPLDQIAKFFLKNMNETIVTPVDHKKLIELWEKQHRPGYISELYMFEKPWAYTVRKKSFKKFIEKNWRKVLQTRKQYDKELTESNIRLEKEYWKSVEEELNEEMKEWNEAKQNIYEYIGGE